MKYLQNTKINKTTTTTIFFILLFVFTTLAGAQTLVDFVPPTQNPPQANINPFDTGELSLPVCSSSQLLTFNSGSFTCVSDYKTQTEKNFAQNPDQNPDLQTPSFDDQGNLIEDYRFLCLSTQYFRGLRETSSGLYAVCELNSLIEIDENAVECPSGYVADGFDEGTVLTSRQIVCKKALEYAFNGLIGREKTLLSKLEIKDDCKTGYVLTKGDETTTDWHCGVNNISAEEEKIYFCSQNKTYKICKNDFDFVPFFNKTTQIFAVGSYGDTDGGGTAKGAVYIFERNLDGTLSQTFKISNNGGGDGLLNVYLDSNDQFGVSTSYSDNTLAVGAQGDDNGGPGKGAVYIFEKDSSGEWEQTLKISDHGDGAEKLDINLDPNDNFGRSVLYLDNQLFVGAHGDGGGGTNKGAVYIFEKDSSGDWEKTLKISDNGGGAGLLDINLDSHDVFGISVNAYKDTLVVGASSDDDGGTNKGAVYIFEKDSSGNWEKTLKISDNGGGAGKLDINLDNNDFLENLCRIQIIHLLLAQ